MGRVGFSVGHLEPGGSLTVLCFPSDPHAAQVPSLSQREGSPGDQAKATSSPPAQPQVSCGASLLPWVSTLLPEGVLPLPCLMFSLPSDLTAEAHVPENSLSPRPRTPLQRDLFFSLCHIYSVLAQHQPQTPAPNSPKAGSYGPALGHSVFSGNFDFQGRGGDLLPG